MDHFTAISTGSDCSITTGSSFIELQEAVMEGAEIVVILSSDKDRKNYDRRVREVVKLTTNKKAVTMEDYLDRCSEDSRIDDRGM